MRDKHEQSITSDEQAGKLARLPVVEANVENVIASLMRHNPEVVAPAIPETVPRTVVLPTEQPTVAVSPPSQELNIDDIRKDVDGHYGPDNTQS